MKKIGVILGLITIFILGFLVICPGNLGGQSPVWELQRRFFSEEYAGQRTEYFITLNYLKPWAQYQENSIFYVSGKGDLFKVKEVYLKVSRDVAEDYLVSPSGTIEYRGDDPYMVLTADALTDGSLCVKMRSGQYTLDGTEETDRRFEEETGMDAGELLKTVQFIRREFRIGLNEISEAEYQKICSRIAETVRGLAIMWGIYILICCLIYLPDKIYEKRVDKDMEIFLQKGR